MDKKYRLLKLIGAMISVVFGLLQVRYFTEFYMDSAALLLTLLGLYVYVSFLDFGLTKPIYAELREEYLRSGSRVTKSYLWLFLVFSILVLFTSIVLIILISRLFNSDLSVMVIASLSISFSSSLYFVFLRAVFEAFEMHRLIEFLDIIRKFLLLMITLFISVLDSIDYYFFLFGLVNIMVLAMALKSLSTQVIFPRLSIKCMEDDLKMIGRNGLNNMLYSVSDLLINNSGIIIIPYLFTDKVVLTYHLWLRLYRGLSLFYRSVMDAEIPRLTLFYFNNELRIFNRRIVRSLYVHISLVTLASFILVLLSNEFFMFFNVEIGSRDTHIVFFVSLWILMFANVIQHRVANVMLSIGGYYLGMRKISFRMLAVVVMTYLFIGYLRVSLVYTLIALSIVMLLSAFFHLRMFKISFDAE